MMRHFPWWPRTLDALLQRGRGRGDTAAIDVGRSGDPEPRAQPPPGGLPPEGGSLHRTSPPWLFGARGEGGPFSPIRGPQGRLPHSTVRPCVRVHKSLFVTGQQSPPTQQMPSQQKLRPFFVAATGRERHPAPTFLSTALVCSPGGTGGLVNRNSDPFPFGGGVPSP